jgi:hypothetical protein
MRRMSWLPRLAGAIVGLAAALAGLSFVLRPAAARAPANGAAPPATAVPFALHLHTTRSDGTGTLDEIAAAAARAGLRAIVVTDHGDGTERREPPAYRAGVLVVDAVELSTWAGHYLALGMAPAPYPLAGEPRAVVEDVARLGGRGIVGHPGSPQDGLRWRDWDAPFDGLEWLNGDSEWRDEGWRLLRPLLTYAWRPVETMAGLVDQPAFVMAQWDRLSARRPVVALAGHDTHARVGLGRREPYRGVVLAKAPSYEVGFRAFHNVALDVSLSGDAAVDAARLLDAVAGGRVYSVVTGLAAAGRVTFGARAGEARAGPGQRLVADGPVTFELAADVPEGATSVLLCDGREVARAAGGRLSHTTPPLPGTCRTEIRLAMPGGDRPWVVVNPVYAGGPGRAATVHDGRPPASILIPATGSARSAAWQPETSPGSVAALADTTIDGDAAVRLTWQLAPGPPSGQFAAIRLAVAPFAHELVRSDRLILRAAADRPMRVWVQLRVPGADDRRWGRSVALDAAWQQLELPFASFVPVGEEGTSTPPLAAIDSVLLAVDTVNARPGDAGAVTFRELWVAR